MAQMVLHKAESRGKANHGWLKSFHSFSFAGYYNPERMGFGALRVLNDDTVSGGMGFGTHPHQNMEIISIPLEGDLEHKDSMGNVSVIRQGDVQVLSAGTGIYHSEYNKNKDETVKFLQIWVTPNQQNVIPRYDQISLDRKDRINRLQQIISPDKDDDGVWIHQDAWFYIGQFDNNFELSYNFKRELNGVYAFVLNGEFEINGQRLQNRDALGIWQATDLKIVSQQANSELLIIEVPMKAS